MKLFIKFICILAILGITVGILPIESIAVTKRRISVSGKIFMPEGMVAPAGGIYLSVNVSLKTDEGTTSNCSTSYIKEGEKSVEYEIAFNGDIESKCWVGYDYTIIGDKPDWAVDAGYYSIKGTTAQYGMRSYVDISSKKAANINMTLLKGKAISGRVTLPKGVVIPGEGVGFLVKLFSDNGTKDNAKDDYYTYDYLSSKYYKYFYTSEDGQISFDYKLTVPTEAKSGYRMEVSTSSPVEGLLIPYYYSPGGGTHNPAKASMIDVNKDKTSGMDMELKTGKQIKGFMITPGGEPAPKGGVAAKIKALSDNATPGETGDDITYECTSYIREGMDSSYFAIVVPDDPSYKYKVSYILYDYIPGYSDIGYYGVNGSVKSEGTASILSADEGTFIDLFLLKK